MLSYPGPDRSVRLDQLRSDRAASRRYRNRRSGEFLKALDLTEERGTGIPKILRAMRDIGSPLPELDYDEDHSYFLVRLPAHPAASEAVWDGATAEVTPQVEVLLCAINGQGSRSDLQTAVGLRARMHFLGAYLNPALDDGLIEMILPDKPRSSKQHYRLTEAGRVW